MSITRANLEVELVSRAQGYLENVGMDVTAEGVNTDLNGPIGYAIRQCGGTVADPSVVEDGDLSSFEASEFDHLADIAEYRLLLNIKRKWGKVDIKAGQLSQNLSQFAEQLDQDIAALKDDLITSYGYGVASLSAGVVDLDFAEHDPEAVE